MHDLAHTLTLIDHLLHEALQDDDDSVVRLVLSQISEEAMHHQV